ncbi:MAG: 4Fe-4S dicluster domain-containing protein [Planctomycetota bacterium]
MWRYRPTTWSGGMFFIATKATTRDVPIETLAVRDMLRIPLWVPACNADGYGTLIGGDDRSGAGRSPGSPLELLVKAGERVHTGQLLARPASGAPQWARVFAPLSGVVGDCITIESAYGFPVAALELEPGEDETEGSTAMVGPAQVTPEERLERLALLGIGFDPGGPAGAASPPERIIIDGLESVPYATARTRTLLEHAPDLIDAACRTAEALGVSEVHLVADRRLGDLVGLLRRQSRHTPIRIVPLPNKYPQCHPRLLFSAVTGHVLPPDRMPRDLAARGESGQERCGTGIQAPAETPAGSLCHNSCHGLLGTWIIGTCALEDIHHALTGGRPPVAQTLTVAGDAVQRPGNYRVPLGAPVAAVLQRVGLRRAPACIVLGNALAGVAVRSADAVIVRGVEGLYAWSSEAQPERDPIGCLRCGFCIEVCPAGIDPVGVFNAVELGRRAEVPLWTPQACIDCGLCDYVCPAALPLMEAVQSARRYVQEGQGG